MKRLLLLFLACTTLFGAGELSNRRAPGFSLPDDALEQHDLADFRGKYVIIEFMRTTCPHCIKFAEIVEGLTIKFRGKVDALSIVLPPDNLDAVKEFIKTHNITIPVLFDSGQVAASYLKLGPANKTVFFPHAFLVNPAGTIVNDWVYGDDTKDIFEGEALSRELERVLTTQK